jgi:hypothetical protein
MQEFFSELLGFPLSVSFHHGRPYSFTIWAMHNRTVGGRSSETQSHSINMNNKSFTTLQ